MTWFATARAIMLWLALSMLARHFPDFIGVALRQTTLETRKIVGRGLVCPCGAKNRIYAPVSGPHPGQPNEGAIRCGNDKLQVLTLPGSRDKCPAGHIPNEYR